MIIGRVIGHIVSTINHPYYDGKKLLMVEREDFSGKGSGYLIAIDGVAGAGVGQRVLVIDEGNSARQIVNDDKAPLRAIIIGIIDLISLEPSANAG